MSDPKAATHHVPARKIKPGAIPRSRSSTVKVETRNTGVTQARDELVTPAPRSSSHPRHLHVIYFRSKGIDDFVSRVSAADPMRLIETERKGLAGIFVKDLSKRMEIPAQRMFDILGVPKATAEKKVAAGELLAGSGGRAALGMARLLAIAREIVENSTAP